MKKKRAKHFVHTLIEIFSGYGGLSAYEIVSQLQSQTFSLNLLDGAIDPPLSIEAQEALKLHSLLKWFQKEQKPDEFAKAKVQITIGKVRAEDIQETTYTPGEVRRNAQGDAYVDKVYKTQKYSVKRLSVDCRFTLETRKGDSAEAHVTEVLEWDRKAR